MSVITAIYLYIIPFSFYLIIQFIVANMGKIYVTIKSLMNAKLAQYVVIEM